jgi:hypothetical protein
LILLIVKLRLKLSLAVVGATEIKLRLSWFKFLMTMILMPLLLRVLAIDCLLF